jgi:DNA repair protein RadD
VSELRPYQLDAVSRLREGLKAGVRKQVLQLPTGAGKTQVASYMTQSAIAKGKRVLFLADRIELIEQASARFDKERIDHGVIQGNHWRHRPYEKVQIGTIQTLLNRQHEPFDVVIVDECHAGGKRLNDWIARQDKSVLIGLSATPWAKGMALTWEKLIVGVTTSYLIENGFLVNVQAWAPSEPDLRGVKVVAGEWEDAALAKVCDTSQLVGDIVQHWKLRAGNRQTICFAVDVAHSKHICEEFKLAGVNAAHVDGYELPHERRATIDAFRKGELQVVTNVGILDKGFDVPQASCLVMARPIRSSLMMHIQQLGRVLRPYEGKEFAIVLDHAGNLCATASPMNSYRRNSTTASASPRQHRSRSRSSRRCARSARR